MADAVAKAAGIPAADGAARGDAGRRPAGGRRRGADRRTTRRWRSSPCGSGQPVGPMLAQTATGVADALERLGGTAVFEAKLDGARVQIHRAGDEVIDLHPQPRRRHRPAARGGRGDAGAAGARPDRRRRGDRAAPRRPPAPVPGHRVAVRPRRSTSRRPGPRSRCRCSSSTSCISTASTCSTRRPPSGWRPWTRSCPPATGSTGWSPPMPAPPSASWTATLAAGHEGVMAKSLTAPYEAGRRGAGWLKVKPVHTLDLVVLAVEWGSGRRTGKLSNIHLGARDPATGGFRHAGQDVQGHDRRDAGLADRAVHRAGRSARPTATSSSCAPSRSSRSRSTACSARRATRAAWRCGSPGCCATATTRARPKPTPSTPCARFYAARYCRLRARRYSAILCSPARPLKGSPKARHSTGIEGGHCGFTHRRTIGSHRGARRRRHLHPHRQRPAAGSDHRPLPDHHPAQDHLRHHRACSARSPGRSSRSSAARRSTRCGSSSRRSAPMSSDSGSMPG